MKKIISVVVFICSIVSLYGQIEFDRPEAFLFERKNNFLKRVDSTYMDSTGVETIATKNKLYAIEKPKAYTGYVSLYGNGYINSNSITNEFIKAYAYTYSYIDADLKQQQVDRLKSSNVVGYDIRTGLYGQYKLKNIRYEAGVSYRDFASVQFSPDMFNLVFYGNSMYAGQTANLDPFKLYNTNYQTFYMGARTTVGSKKNMEIAGRLGFVRGGRLQKINSKNLSLYTDANGSFLTLNGKFDVAYTEDSMYATIPPMNGAGITTDLFYAIKGKKGTFTLELLDLGFVKWKDVATFSGDSSYTYSGLDVENILGTGGIKMDPINLTSFFDNLGLTKVNKDVTYMLPATLNVSYYRNISAKVSFSGSVRQQFVYGYKPRVSAKLAYYLKKDFVLIPTIAYGGFGRADIELGVAKTFAERLIVSANLMWFEYLVLPNSTSGNGMSVAFSYYF
jgi:hypothetical protein